MLVGRLGANGQPAEGGALRVPDGRMFVYDTESDNFLTCFSCTLPSSCVHSVLCCSVLCCSCAVYLPASSVFQGRAGMKRK